MTNTRPQYVTGDTASGYCVLREDGSYAEFLDRDEAEEAVDLLSSGEVEESRYEWIDE